MLGKTWVQPYGDIAFQAAGFAQARMYWFKHQARLDISGQYDSRILLVRYNPRALVRDYDSWDEDDDSVKTLPMDFEMDDGEVFSHRPWLLPEAICSVSFTLINSVGEKIS